MAVNKLGQVFVRAGVALCLAASPVAASAGIIFPDGFCDGDRDNNGTTETTATNALGR